MWEQQRSGIPANLRKDSERIRIGVLGVILKTRPSHCIEDSRMGYR